MTDSAASCSASALDELAAAELLEVEDIGRGRGPEPQRVDGLAAVADDRAVERNAEQARGPADDGMQRAPRAPRRSSRA